MYTVCVRWTGAKKAIEIDKDLEGRDGSKCMPELQVYYELCCNALVER